MKSRRLIAILLVLVMGISQFTVALADKKSDAENKKQQAEENLKSKQNEIDNIEQEQAQLQSEIDALDGACKCYLTAHHAGGRACHQTG